MSLATMLQQSGVIESMAGELGIDPQTAKVGAGALLPAIVAGMGRSATGSGGGGALGGLGGLAGAIMGGGGGGMLDAVLGQKPTPTQQGNDILGNIFGSKDVSRGVAGEVAALTGIDEGVLKKMLPILAMAAAGYMAKNATGGGQGGAGGGAGGGALGGILGSIVTGMMSR
ncbi:DUF937 domain-containing protein [Pontixanthobacter aestiaquae]|uniref:DUF937 domain-containing protein n=1 Tax=Pontixanthobacter aestiaquae TaxID=1509367 RepID=A0A844Z6U8_9SPHN|nr:DUF937 domain-containing protein [Pontixanthobacter aestiaquae]MDN3645955.1 DUF937 domain-containing protein [Pontixanthobacter aestiaquae]MXO83052.1 DUF937 domain-containing protein [Pontixanthobacter aestiaquae]